MNANEIKFEYHENEQQRFYDAYIGKDYLYVFANKHVESNPDIFFASYIKNGDVVTIMDKAANDEERKRTCGGQMRKITMLARGEDELDYLKGAVVYCYEHNLNEY